jgi:hypothetical protein
MVKSFRQFFSTAAGDSPLPANGGSGAAAAGAFVAVCERRPVHLGALLLLTSVFVCCCNDSGGSVDVSDVCDAECEQRQECDQDMFDEQFDSIDDCVDMCLEEPEDYDALVSECQDIYWEYWMCLNSISCEDYENDDYSACDDREAAVDSCYEENLEYCEGYDGSDSCCQEDNPCGFGEGAECVCDGTCGWEASDCG